MCHKSREKKLVIRHREKKFKCKSCGETAHKKAHLCKPKKYKSAS